VVCKAWKGSEYPTEMNLFFIFGDEVLPEK
jgi:hypothetical protein